MEIQQRFATVYRAICERFRQGQTPDEELKKLIIKLEECIKDFSSRVKLYEGNDEETCLLF
jgi:hypothetical protein